MSRTQLLWSELLPRIDIDTVAICDTKEVLHLAHYPPMPWFIGLIKRMPVT